MMTNEFATVYFNKIGDVHINGRKLSFPDSIDPLPDWIEFIAADADGEVYGYDSLPALNDEGGCYVVHKVGMKTLWLFTIDIDKNTNWKDTLVRLSCVIDTLKESGKMAKQVETKFEYKSILKFNLWQPGENTLVGNIVEAKNVPESIFLINTGKTGFMQTSSGLLIGDEYNKSKDMVKTFDSSKDRDKYVKDLSDNIRNSFKNTYLEASEADIGKEVCIENPSNMKGILRAVTTDGKYVVEIDELRIVDKAWSKQENKVKHCETGYVDGRVLYEFKIM